MYPLKPCWIDCWKSGKNAQENGLSQPALNQWDNSLTITHPLWDKEQVVSLQGAQSMGGCGWREMRTYYGFFWCHSKMKRMTWFLILNTAQVKFGSACAILSWWTANSSFAWKTSWRKLSLLACSSFRKDFHVELTKNCQDWKDFFHRFVGLLAMLTAGGLDRFWKRRSPKKGVATWDFGKCQNSKPPTRITNHH